MPTGRIARMPPDKPFFFIKPDEKGKADVFAHKSACQEPYHTYEEGQRVNYEEEQTAKGPRASLVERI